MWTRLATARFNLEVDKFGKQLIKYVHGGNQYEMKAYPTAPVPVVIIKMRIWLFFRNSLSILFRRGKEEDPSILLNRILRSVR